MKRSSVFNLFLRAYRLCDYPHLEGELKYLHNAFRSVGFPEHVISSVHSRVKRKIYSKPVAPPTTEESLDENPPVLFVPHGAFVADTVRPIFRDNGCKIVHPATNTLRKSLVWNRPPRCVDVGDCAGVYRIPCVQCSSAYYGETGRGFNTRISEHKAAVRLGHRNNACFKHCSEAGHNIDWGNARLICMENDWLKRQVVESSCIVKQQNFNNMMSTLSIDTFSAGLILNSGRVNLNPP